MKTAKWFAISSVLVLASLAPAQNSAAMRKRLTNQDIISMVQMGLSEDVVTAKIRATNAAEPASISFDTSVDGLKALKAVNVPDAVIRVMINPGPPQPAVITTAAPMTLDLNLPPPEVGVYWKDGGRFVMIEGQAMSQAKIGGRAGAMFTYGFRGLHWDAYVNGPSSSHVVKERRPVFYLYVPDGTSSSDYSLMKLNKKGNRREFQIGSLSGKMGGGKAGLKADKEIVFQSEHVGIRTYKVTLDQDLNPGEYAFFMATGQQVGATGGEGTGGAATGRIYDFSLPE
jgi:hypothetical protein